MGYVGTFVGRLAQTASGYPKEVFRPVTEVCNRWVALEDPVGSELTSNSTVIVRPVGSSVKAAWDWTRFWMPSEMTCQVVVNGGEESGSQNPYISLFWLSIVQYAQREVPPNAASSCTA
jgi:hypothetical protein